MKSNSLGNYTSGMMKKILLPKLKIDKILDRLNFLKHNSKTHKTREGYYLLNRYVCYKLKGLNFNIHLHW